MSYGDVDQRPDQRPEAREGEISTAKQRSKPKGEDAPELKAMTMLGIAGLLCGQDCDMPSSNTYIAFRKRVKLPQSKNSKCSCGSGKKFKKCCMAAGCAR